MPFLRKWTGLSETEMAFTRSRIERVLYNVGFDSIKVEPYDFVFPLLPRFLIKPMKVVSNFLQTLPVIKEFGGSLLIYASRPL